jgi:C4-dicarboxylate-specific signal transduction histidine kinase
MLNTQGGQQQLGVDTSARRIAPRESILGQLLIGPVQLFAFASGLALLVALGLLVALTWRGLQRLEPFDQHLQQQQGLLAVDRSIRELRVANLAGTVEPSSTRLLPLKTEISALVAADGFADPTTRANLLAAAHSLESQRDTLAALDEANAHIQRSLDNEGLARRRSILTFHENARMELSLAIVALLVLPATALLVLMMLRERVVRPLRDLNNLLALLLDPSREPAPTAGVVAPLQPVIENYNRLVVTLRDALSSNKTYQAQLESRVRAATETLLRQRIELAEADRLSAIGEMSARVAHELRNPLAGIQVGLSNLLQDCSDPDQRERLRLISAEVARMARLLAELLIPAHRQTEHRRLIEIKSFVSDLLDLARYQVPSKISLMNDVPNHLSCCLQPDAMRQMLLNLVLNSSQAIGEGSGTIAVTAACDGRHFRLCVQDDGPGFPTELLERGPRPFHSSRGGGSGLGLSTVSRMARAMGGQLKLRNRSPNGAEATLILLGTTDADGHASDH